MVDFKSKIKEEAKLNVHTHFQHLSIPELQNLSKKDRLPYSLMLLSVTGELNIGVAVRSAHLLGASNVYIVGRRKYDKRSTVGAQNYVDVFNNFALDKDYEHVDVSVVRNLLIEKNMTPIMVEHGGLEVGTFDWKEKLDKIKNPCLILGSEGNGIPDDILNLEQELGGFRVSILQLGVIRSYNVSVAASIVMHDLALSLRS